MNIWNPEEIIAKVRKAVFEAEIELMPDTRNTYACYVLRFEGWEIWVNARNGFIVSMGRIINRV